MLSKQSLTVLIFILSWRALKKAHRLFLIVYDGTLLQFKPLVWGNTSKNVGFHRGTGPFMPARPAWVGRQEVLLSL